MDAPEDLHRARELVSSACRIVALTGAGISTDSGIPDFRGPNGLWTTRPGAERLSNLQAYVSSREVREQSWQARLEHPAWQAEPNAAHRAFVELERLGTLSAVLTQNVDGLHQEAGSSNERVLELHGTMFQTSCLSCADRREMRQVLQRVRAGETDPPCEVCGGILKSATISFGQSLDPEVLERARQEVRDCDLMLAVGTSLTVQPVAGLVATAATEGADVLVCNAHPTPYDGCATVVLRGAVAEVLPALVPAEPRTTGP
ncbi:Sir2 family NAD-dependent protein deacetylase [Haloechinothrix sp. LS1_15]|uniref:SIR2 family NAD-dependent protein deacylase n=1 Tax=Haloechinothrix sp. LS1_15 TaxID=2652248 RepID=UPI0029452587|nr:Sir2 family NAD-dependent protein deacetylase [Haloechinothrix sp. LS1_15]MDV6014720.1 NAD-dependent deacetylase [Haloechinothrix sp. LS1_15]